MLWAFDWLNFIVFDNFFSFVCEASWKFIESVIIPSKDKEKVGSETEQPCEENYLYDSTPQELYDGMIIAWNVSRKKEHKILFAQNACLVYMSKYIHPPHSK